MERYEKLEMQVIAFEVDDVLGQTVTGVAVAGSGQTLTIQGRRDPVGPGEGPGVGTNN